MQNVKTCMLKERHPSLSSRHAVSIGVKSKRIRYRLL